MLIGDSITDGYYWSYGVGFRDDLFTLIQESGWPFEFVGSYGDAPYQGHFKGGACIGDFYPTGRGKVDVTADMNLRRPNIAIIHLGTNDMASENYYRITPYSYNGGYTFDTTTVSGRMATLVSWLCRWKNGTYGSDLRFIFVSQIIPKNVVVQSYKLIDENDEVVAFNKELAAIMADAEAGHIHSIPRGTLRLVDQYSTFDVATMVASDSTHPNDAGYAHMAEVFWDSLRTLPMHIAAVQTGWTGVPGIAVGPIQAKVMNDYGNPISGYEGRFVVSSGDATIVKPDTVLTDGSGLAGAMILINTPGESAIQANADNLVEASAGFTLTTQPMLIVEGTVRYRGTEKGIPDVTVFRSGSNSSTITDSSGRYKLYLSFDGHEVVLIPRKARWNGIGAHPVSKGDALQTARLVAGLENQTAGMVLSADVDGDGRITARDAALIARYAAGFSDSFAENLGTWFFEPDSIDCGILHQDRSDLDMEGGLCGDVDGL
jgi:lysophospholipase L1-like esterase